MIDLGIDHAGGLLGALLGAGVVYAVVQARLSTLVARHREELIAQQEQLTASFLECLKSQVVEIRAQAQVRLLGLLFNHLSEKCLPAYRDARELCEDCATIVNADDLKDLTRRFEQALRRSARAVDGITEILEGNRNQDEIYGKFRDLVSQAPDFLAPMRTSLDAVSACANGRGEFERAAFHRQCDSLTATVTRYGQWIKQSMEDAARMQNALLSEQAPKPVPRPAANDSEHQDLDFVI